MYKSVYFPENPETKEILRRVDLWRESRAKLEGVKKPAFGDAVLAGLKKLVSVSNGNKKR